MTTQWIRWLDRDPDVVPAIRYEETVTGQVDGHLLFWPYCVFIGFFQTLSVFDLPWQDAKAPMSRTRIVRVFILIGCPRDCEHRSDFQTFFLPRMGCHKPLSSLVN